jgi:hypothetical protein
MRHGKDPHVIGGHVGVSFSRLDSYSTVTDFARFLGLSMSLPRAFAVW